jgi:hypothetical protein
MLSDEVNVEILLGVLCAANGAFSGIMPLNVLI